MRALVLSDIHHNIEHMRLLRKKERNVYDVVLVAGDIGIRIIDEFFSILDSFNCPSFCVYGNWDNDFPYKTSLSNCCTLLHHNIEEVGGFFVAGFSGCSASWGRNPIYLAHKKELSQKYSDILLQFSEVEKCVVKQEHEIEESCQEEIDRLSKKTKDRRRKEYKKRVARIEAKKVKEIRRVREVIEKIKNTRGYKKFEEERWALSRTALFENRKKLFDLIRSSNVPQSKLIIVTHERMYKIAEERVLPLLHIFGHIHKYQFNFFKGTYYLNASPIDYGFSAIYGSDEILPEGYCDVTISERKVTVKRRTIFEGDDLRRWLSRI